MYYLAQRLYAPVFFFGFIGMALFLVANQPSRLWLLIPLFIVAVSVAFAAEQLMPYDRTWNADQGDSKRDAAHGIVNETFNALGLCTIPALAAVMPFKEFWPNEWPLALQLLVAIVIADAGITLAHWGSHRVSALWRLHAVHHSVTRMYSFNGLMKHPLHQTVEAIAGVMPLLLCGMPIDVAALLTFAVLIQLLLQHANVDMQLGQLRKVFAWAPLHRFHHMKYGTAGDVNFGLFLNLWDYLLGTNFDHPRYVIGTKDLGIGSQPDYPRRYIAQLLAPFKRAATTPSPPLPPALQDKV